MHRYGSAELDWALIVVSLDLWGRGYSDNPKMLPHDTRLLYSAILLALVSSDLCWTGSSQFALVGYSFGGGIAADFMSFSPYLVSRLVLIAPSGIVRTTHVSNFSKLLYSEGLLPEPLVEHLVKLRLKGQPSAAVAVEEKQRTFADAAVEEEVPGEDHEELCPQDNFEMRPAFSASDAVVSHSKVVGLYLYIM